jgi:hypothetical protein
LPRHHMLSSGGGMSITLIMSPTCNQNTRHKNGKTPIREYHCFRRQNKFQPHPVNQIRILWT